MKLSIRTIFFWLAIMLAGLLPGGCNVAEDKSDCEEDLVLTFRFMVRTQDKCTTDVS